MARVLMIDDSAFARMRLKQSLAGYSFEILEAQNGEEGLSLIRSEKLDFILLDLIMPGMTGFDVLAVMQREGIKKPVVILTADVQEDTRNRCLGLGALAVLHKPPKPTELSAVLEKVLGKEGN